jgi:hypothetical protein
MPLCYSFDEQSLFSFIHVCMANEGPVRIQYKCLVPIYVFLEIKLLIPKQKRNT